MWLCSTLCVLIQDLGWTPLESTSKIMLVGIKNASFGYDLIWEIWISEGIGCLARGPPDFWNLLPGEKCFAPHSQTNITHHGITRHVISWLHVQVKPGARRTKIRTRIENVPFGYDLTFEIWISEGRGPLARGCLDFWNLPPGGECFAPSRHRNMRHQKYTRNLEESMILKMNQNTRGDFLMYRKLSRIIFDTPRLHKTWFQEVDVFRNLKILTKSWPIVHTCAWIQNLRWT